MPPNATSDESGSTHTTAPVATLTEPRGSHRRDESSDKGTDVDSQNKPRYHFVFDDWSAFCAGPPGLDVAQVFFYGQLFPCVVEHVHRCVVVTVIVVVRVGSRKVLVHR